MARNLTLRAPLVDFQDVVVLDAFVRPKERVVDYRTQFSSIRPDEIVNAKPLEEVQKQVAGLLEDRILQVLGMQCITIRWRYSSRTHARQDAIRNCTLKYYQAHAFAPRCSAALVRQELGVMIQEREHSSVTDAWATMAVYRLHRRDWENGQSHKPSSASQSKNRKRAEAEIESRRKETDGDEEDEGSIADDPGSVASIFNGT